MDKQTILDMQHVSFVYDSDRESSSYSSEPTEPPALSDVSLTVKEGEYVAVLGHNGSGKSTLAKLINMILTPTEGVIRLFGRDVTTDDFTEEDMYDMRERVGMVFQNPDNQLVATVVEEDVAFGPENLALPREEIRRRVHTALAVVGMTEYAHHAPHKLSGGQKQRVAIAGVLAMKPKVIIFDESTAMLDPLGRRQIVDLMDKLNHEDGITILHITHYMQEAARADRVIVMDDGHIVLDGAPREVFSQVERLRDLGLEAPQGTELIHRLRADGWDIADDGLTVDACAEAILQSLGLGKE
ncbi:MAG: energy-coupling factor transporter ATPase [Clostridia bacterium]|nr:energy-coupling factor transporter ATPase [Clostridia bacterium]